MSAGASLAHYVLRNGLMILTGGRVGNYGPAHHSAEQTSERRGGGQEQEIEKVKCTMNGASSKGHPIVILPLNQS